MVALAMSTKKPTAEMAEPIWGPGQPPLIAMAVNDQAGKRRDPGRLHQQKLKVPHVSAEIARMV